MQSLPRNILAIAILCICSSTTLAAGPPQSSEKDRERVVEYATRIEQSPLSKRSRSDRKKVLTIIQRSPDLQVDSCQAVLGELLLSHKLGATELYVHHRIASARFLAEHPDMQGDRFRVVLEGVIGVLRAYRYLQQSNGLVQIEALDDLIERQKNGELDDYVARALAECP